MQSPQKNRANFYLRDGSVQSTIFVRHELDSLLKSAEHAANNLGLNKDSILFTELEDVWDLKDSPAPRALRPHVFAQGEDVYTIKTSAFGGLHGLNFRVNLQKQAVSDATIPMPKPRTMAALTYILSQEAVDKALEEDPNGFFARLSDYYVNAIRSPLSLVQYQALPLWRKWLTTRRPWRALARAIKLIIFSKVQARRRFPFFYLEIPQPPPRIFVVRPDGIKKVIKP